MGDEKLLENDVVNGSAENLDTVLMDYMDDDMTDENADPFNPVIDENDPKYIGQCNLRKIISLLMMITRQKAILKMIISMDSQMMKFPVKDSLFKWMSFSGKIQMAYLTIILR